MTNTYIVGDCVEVMRQMPDESVDLIVTSPPYNMGSGKSLGYQPRSTVGQRIYESYDDNMNPDEYYTWCISIITECLRVSRYVFWNMQYVRSTRDAIVHIQDRFRENLKDIFIWHKQSVASITSKSGGMAKGWEYVFMFGQDNRSTFNYNNFPENGYVPNIKTWYKSKYFTNHHATFPEELPRYFIEHFTKKGDLVLDPFAGSGTTAVACIELNRNWICIDIEPKYRELAMKRIQGATIGMVI